MKQTIELRGESHIDFLTKSVMITLASGSGGGRGYC